MYFAYPHEQRWAVAHLVPGTQTIAIDVPGMSYEDAKAEAARLNRVAAA